MSSLRRVAIMIDLQWPLRHHQEIFAGTQRYARERNNWECTIDLHACEGLRSGRTGSDYDGVIARATSRLATRARAARVPVVNVWLNSPARRMPSVLHDAEAAGRMAAEHLIARGLRHFAFLGYFNDRGTQLEATGFRAAASAAGFASTVHYVSRNCSDTLSTWKKFQANLAQLLDVWPRPIGICVCHDVLARYLISACQRKKVRVPDDAAVVSTSNELVICLHPEPTISSISFDFDEIGYLAAGLLDRMMDGAAAPRRPLLIAPVELVARQSTDVCAVGDPSVAQAMRFMSENCGQRLRVADVAKHVHLTRRTLERRFHDLVGRTISAEISRLRIERVKRQLAEGNERIKTLATRLGYSSAKRLCEVFRHLEGVTPGEFRRQRRKPVKSAVAP